MREDFENLQLWRPQEAELVHAVMERGIPVELSFAPKRATDTVSLAGTFVRVQGNMVRFDLAEGAGTSLEAVLQGKELDTPLTCEVKFRIDYGMLADDALMPGQYSGNAGIVGMTRAKNGVPAFFDLHVNYHFTRRKTRRFERVACSPDGAFLVHLQVVRGEPSNWHELRPLLTEVMHGKDNAHALVDISVGGAYINVESHLAERGLNMGEGYLMVLLPNRNDPAIQPLVFRAKRVAVVRDRQNTDISGLRLHFASELDWRESSRETLVWRNIWESGSQDLGPTLDNLTL